MHDNIYFCDPDQHSNAFNPVFALQLPCDTQGAYDIPVLGWCINFKRHCINAVITTAQAGLELTTDAKLTMYDRYRAHALTV